MKLPITNITSSIIFTFPKIWMHKKCNTATVAASVSNFSSPLHYTKEKVSNILHLMLFWQGGLPKQQFMRI